MEELLVPVAMGLLGLALFLAAVVMVVVLLLGGIAGAAVLCRVAKRTVGLEVHFGRAYAAVVLAGLTNYIIGFGTCIQFGGPSGFSIIAILIIHNAIGFFVGAGIIGCMIRVPYQRALVVTLPVFGLWLLLVVVLLAVEVIGFTAA